MHQNKNGNSDIPSSDFESEEEEEEEEESPEEFTAPKVLPERTTRGKRGKLVEPELAEKDSQFWGHDTWKDEGEDEEWHTDNEGNYKDIIDSDFDETTSEDDDDNNIEPLDMEQEKKLKRSMKNMVYVDPRLHKKQAQKLAALPLFRDHSPPPPKRKGKVVSQAQHLMEAKKTELANISYMQELENEQMQKENLQQQEKALPIWKGPVEIGISWSSKRLIEAEENRRIVPRAEDEEVHARELLFFLDFTDITHSKIPDYYLPREVFEKPTQRKSGIYRHPATLEIYRTKEEFLEIHKQYHKKQHAEIANVVETAAKSMSVFEERVASFL
eukprot:GHVP01051353.1.p5 GENE.GHVP01051353.1~~GHVP01051353.1.p5  ORF type:complete len:329 (-),score=96.18 GHVP01051353.1:9424-10410(-)